MSLSAFTSSLDALLDCHLVACPCCDHIVGHECPDVKLNLLPIWIVETVDVVKLRANQKLHPAI